MTENNNEKMIKELIDHLIMATTGLRDSALIEYSKGCRGAEPLIEQLERQNNIIPITRNKNDAKIVWLWVRFRYVLNAELRRNAETFAMKRDALMLTLGFLK